jgi:hypothetical protein
MNNRSFHHKHDSFALSTFLNLINIASTMVAGSNRNAMIKGTTGKTIEPTYKLHPDVVMLTGIFKAWEATGGKAIHHQKRKSERDLQLSIPVRPILV